MKRICISMICIIVLGVASYAAFGKSVHPPSRAASTTLAVTEARAEHSNDVLASSSRRTTALQARVAQLDADVTSLRERLEESEALSSADSSAGNAVPVPGDRSEVAQQRRAWHEHMMDVDSEFRAEGTDPSWSSSTAVAVQRALDSSNAMRGKMRSIECRSQTCRVEIVDDGSGAVSKDLPIFVQQFAEELPNMQADQVDDGDGHRVMVLYMTRNGNAPSSAADASR
ncbi:hypothetical protein WMF37_46220 [Sorangium sp. So ce291]|uniref:hypothetical protein n=1 Tax=Sorangium sp. So ce291 TaxID=3133294 RepID=UPI003F648CC0